MTTKERYTLNKKSIIGDTCVCPSCQTQFVKSHYQQAFCKSKPGTFCKDAYWNRVTPTKRNNTTRISPASARWMERQANKIYDSMHPFEGLNDESYKSF